jgi:Secretion system C-terminal sorting domain/Glycosyl hydrolases family 16
MPICGIPQVAAKVPINCPRNSTTRTDWNLIFDDDFDESTLNLARWDISQHLDDRVCDGSGAGNNHGNVEVKTLPDGNRVCRITIANAAYGVACPFTGGEIKSFANGTGSPFREAGFVDYKFYRNYYVEMRIKAPKAGKGVGCSGWLYAFDQPTYNEIDIMEMFGPTRGNPSSLVDAVLQTYILKRSITPPSNLNLDPNHLDRLKANLYNQVTNQPFNPDSQYIIYGMEVRDRRVRWFINNILVRDLDLNAVPACDNGWILADNLDATFFGQKTRCRYEGYPVPVPMALRIGAGYGCLGDDNYTQLSSTESGLPAYMDIDYVRVYTHKDTKANQGISIRGNDSEKQLCTLPGFNNANLATTYYPDAVYQWSCPVLDIINSGTAWQWGTVKSNTLSGVYTVTCTITYKGGYTETITQNFNVSTGVPPTPNLYCTIGTKLGYCNYALRTGATNTPVGTLLQQLSGPSLMISARSTATLTFRHINGCGISSNTATCTVTAPYCAGGGRREIGVVKDSSQIDIENQLTEISQVQEKTPKSELVQQLPQETFKEHFFRKQQEAEQNVPIKIFPNPTQGDIVIQSIFYGEKVNLQVYDINGSILRNINLPEIQTKISISDLPNGVYMLRINDEEQEIYQYRLVKTE